MSLGPTSLYNALIRRSIDLRRLYQHVARRVAEPGLRSVLQENAAALELLILDLQMQSAARGGRPATQGRLVGPLERMLATWWARGLPVHDPQWIRLLAWREGALLQAFDDALHLAPIEAAVTLGVTRSRLQAVHLDMDCLAATAR